MYAYFDFISSNCCLFAVTRPIVTSELPILLNNALLFALKSNNIFGWNASEAAPAVNAAARNCNLFFF